MDELTEVQMELHVVKAALRSCGDHLGMKGETLQQYLLQLNQKENILLSRNLKPANGGCTAIAGAASGEVDLPTLAPNASAG